MRSTFADQTNAAKDLEDSASLLLGVANHMDYLISVYVDNRQAATGNRRLPRHATQLTQTVPRLYMRDFTNRCVSTAAKWLLRAVDRSPYLSSQLDEHNEGLILPDIHKLRMPHFTIIDLPFGVNLVFREQVVRRIRDEATRMRYIVIEWWKKQDLINDELENDMCSCGSKLRQALKGMETVRDGLVKYEFSAFRFST
ncbi:hypothetical protein FGB62_119g05 [Gracilaria domingensis]|nr:hypothetical protein FGB62_119g05 [Gracilaria domingensis]